MCFSETPEPKEHFSDRNLCYRHKGAESVDFTRVFQAYQLHENDTKSIVKRQCGANNYSWIN